MPAGSRSSPRSRGSRAWRWGIGGACSPTSRDCTSSTAAGRGSREKRAGVARGRRPPGGLRRRSRGRGGRPPAPPRAGPPRRRRRGAAVYAIPDGYTPMVVVYNKDLFDRGGIPYPSDDWTWDDFTRIAKLLTRDTDGDGRIDQWGTAFDRRPFLWIPWIWAGGGDVLCADGRRATGCLDAAATVDAIRWYTDWVTRDSIAPRAHNPLTSGDDFRLFTSGRIAMMTTGHSWVPRL